jgi:RNA polymerase sigma factor (sigma-70 family)
MRVRRPDPMDADVLLSMLPAAIDDPAEAAASTDTMDRLRPALDRLPPEQRRAVLLATLAGRTTTEIAAIEQIPIPTAKTRLRIGLAKLQTAVAREAKQ